MQAESAPASESPVAVSSDGRYVAFLGNFGFGCCVVALHDRQTGTTTNEASANSGSSVSMSADGRYFAYILSGDVFLRDRQGDFETVSVAPGGAPAACDWQNCVKSSSDPSLSADGRFVAFYSFASNLVSGDTNQTADVFVRDRQTGVTKRVSVATDGTQGNGISVEPAISADGRYVAFMSEATTLVPGDINGARDIFLHDRQTGAIERVSVGSDTSQDKRSWGPAISGDGRYVAFTSAASTLIPSDTNGAWDVFVRDRQAGTTERVSVTSEGLQAPCPPQSCRSAAVSITPDGRYVSFHSFVGLDADDANQTGDIFVHDRTTDATERVSVAYPGLGMPGYPPSNGNSTSGPDADQPSAMSADARIVAFDSFASNLVPGDGGARDVFVRDRGPAAGVGQLTAGPGTDRVDASGWTTFSGSALASVSDPANDGAAGGNDILAARIAYRPEPGNLSGRIDLAGVPSAPLYGFEMTVGGVRYDVRGGPPGPAGTFALYECDLTCTQTATLTGSFGTAGNDVRVSIPLASLGADAGTQIQNVRAYAATGPGAAIDTASLANSVIPTKTVSLGIARADVPVDQINFSTPAPLTDGDFTGSLDTTGYGGGSWLVYARGCLGAECGVASTPIELDGNLPPALNPIGNKFGSENQQLRFTISASDQEADPLTFSASNLPQGATFDPTTQTFDWTPSYDQAGTYPGVRFQVGDGTSTDSETISIAVNDVDISGPAVTIDSGPPSIGKNTNATFMFSASEPATFECSLDGTPFASCTSPVSFNELAEGPHTFGVRGSDVFWNTGPAVSWNWSVDITPPDAVITAGPQGVVDTRSATFSFSSTESGSTFRCSLDGAAFTACTSPRSYTALATGDHTFSVAAVDAAGNVDATPAVQAWTVVIVVATPEIESPIEGSLQPASTNITGTATPRIRVRLFEGTRALASVYADATGAFSSTVLFASGSHAITAKAIDGGGTSSADSPPRRFEVDAGPPSITIATPNNSLLVPGDLITGSATDNRSVAQIELRYIDAAHQVAGTHVLDADGSTSVSWAAEPSVATGYYTVEATAIDSVGNRSAKRTIAVFVIRF